MSLTSGIMYVFQSTRPTWGATASVVAVAWAAGVSIHAPHVGRDIQRLHVSQGQIVSIHAPHVGRDRNPRSSSPSIGRFNPRAPRGARRVPILNGAQVPQFQSTRPTWGATGGHHADQQERQVSIHAPHVGRDLALQAGSMVSKFQSTRPTWGATHQPRQVKETRDVSIHAPHVGRDVPGRRRTKRRRMFQSTRPTWGATSCRRLGCRLPESFNPRAPRGARLALMAAFTATAQFQSTRPTWGATRKPATPPTDGPSFNPRAPRGARRAAAGPAPLQWRFNPRAPRGARLRRESKSALDFSFQSTRPTWGATTHELRGSARRNVSIHAPHVGRDRSTQTQRTEPACFNPRAPRGARLTQTR